MAELSQAEVARYSRHLLLPEFGVSGQQRLKEASVLCIGAGGLGSPVLLYLAAAGVGRIGIVDHDVVDESNLQRQVVHGTSGVGTSKVRSAVARIRELNPMVTTEGYDEALTSANALGLLESYDVIVDGTDNFPTRYLVNDACILLGKPLVYGSIYRFEGQASVFNHEGGPDYRDLYPEPPPPGMVPSCAEGGVMGVLPGLIGTIQATETLKLLAGLGTSLSGRLLLFDALQMSFRELALSRDVDRAPITELVDYDAFCGVPKVLEVPSITVEDFSARWHSGWRPFVLDVRKAHEADIVSLPFVDRRVAVDELRADSVSTDRDIVVLCRSGIRSATAVDLLIKAGLRKVWNLEGGLLAWSDRIDPTVPTY